LAETGKFEQGIAEMERATESFRRTGGNVSLPYTQALLAQAYARIGEFDKALAMLDDSLRRIQRTGERRDQAEILRFKGEALLMRDAGAIAQAEKCLRQARTRSCSGRQVVGAANRRRRRAPIARKQPLR
jgi:hypothetical protein